MLDRLFRLAGSRVESGRTEEAPSIQRSVTEELVDGAVKLIAALLDGVVLNALAFVDGRVAAGLDLELIDCVNRDSCPHKAGITVAASADKGDAVDVDVRHSTLGAGAVHDAGVGGGVTGGVVALHAGHEEGKVSRATLVGLAVGSHFDRQRGVHVVLHGRAEGGVGGFELGRERGDGDALIRRTDGQLGAEALRFKRVDLHVLLGQLFKAFGGDDDRVHTGVKGRNAVIAGRGAGGRGGNAVGVVCDDNSSVGDRGTCGVKNCSRDGALTGELSLCGSAEQQERYGGDDQGGRPKQPTQSLVQSCDLKDAFHRNSLKGAAKISYRRSPFGLSAGTKGFCIAGASICLLSKSCQVANCCCHTRRCASGEAHLSQSVV